MATYFISDLHLELAKPAMTAGFVDFISNLKDAERLYILGDFFEVWIGDDYTDDMVEEVRLSLSQLASRGCQIFMMHGNRDFLLGEQFCESCQATLLDENSVISVGDQQALLLHGDSLCTEDIAYMNMRQLFRNPQWQATILAKSLPERIEFARSIRSESAESQQGKTMEIMDVTAAEVDKVLSDSGQQRMIHGHTHRPADHHWEFDGTHRERWVLGDWSESQGWYIRWQEGQNPDLVKFDFK